MICKIGNDLASELAWHAANTRSFIGNTGTAAEGDPNSPIQVAQRNLDEHAKVRDICRSLYSSMTAE